MSQPTNEQEIGERFRALEDGSEPVASSQLRRFVRDRAFVQAAPLPRTAAAACPNPFRRAVVGIAAAFLLVIAGTGMWLSLHGPINGENPTASPTESASPSATSSASAEATGSPLGPTDSPSLGPTDSAYPDPWTTYSFRPAPKLSPVAIAGNATIGTRQRTGSDKPTNLQWDFFEPVVATPGRGAGAAINSSVQALFDSRVAELQQEFGDPQRGGPPEHTVTLITSFAVLSSAGPRSDPSAGFVSLRIVYSFNNPPWADAGPQYIDFLVYDLKTGKRISISDLFTNTAAALQRLSAAAAADPGITQWTYPGPPTTGYEPTPENFVMWAPTRSGLQTTFGWLQLGSAVSGTPAFTVPWSQLSDLFKPNSYLAWYAAALSSSTAYPSGTLAYGTFGLTGSMLAPEGTLTTTLLQDGRVLLTGLAAQLYDPSTGAFVATGQMPNVRSGQTATLLQEGEVLVAGGANSDGTAFDASAQLYDPKTGKFTAAGSMTSARSFQTATLLKDGRVLIAGGNDTIQVVNSDGSESPINELASAELYDPKTGKFTATGSMTTGRAFHSATLLADGRVLIVGGSSDAPVWSAPGAGLASAEIYDPSTGKFSATGSMASARSSDTATLMKNGRVLITGSVSWGQSNGAAEVYDPTTGKFSAATLSATGGTEATATLLQDGRVLIVGGFGAGLYDPQTGTLSATGSMVISGYPKSAVLLQDGRVLVLGGEATGAAAEIYQP